MPDAIQSLCEAGQTALLATDYLEAERSLVAAEHLAWQAEDFDALSRLYMPLQEARRQRRQTCGDGAFATILARDENDVLSAVDIADRFPCGHLLVAGFATIEPVLALRTLADQRQLYLDLPLAAVYRVAGQSVVLLVPTPESAVPGQTDFDSIDALLQAAPPHSVVTPADAVPPDQGKGDARTFAHLMAVWEALAGPWLAIADAETEPKAKLAAYRQTIRADYACEFAHQRFSETARQLARRK